MQSMTWQPLLTNHSDENEELLTIVWFPEHDVLAEASISRSTVKIRRLADLAGPCQVYPWPEGVSSTIDACIVTMIKAAQP